MFPRNDELRSLLRTKAAEIAPLRTIGDPPLAKMVVAEFPHLFADRTPDAAYQIVCYYLRDKKPTKDRREVYTVVDLNTLSLMTKEERETYATEHNKTIRTLNAAVARYQHRLERGAYTRMEETAAKKRIDDNNHFDFALPSELNVMLLHREDITKLRKELQHPYGLSLRSPNILYHAPSKRRYLLTTNEQMALVADPANFLKMRAPHIKDHWISDEEWQAQHIEPVEPEEPDTPEIAPMPKATGDKYTFTGEQKQESSAITLFRIKSCATKKLGGWIQSEANLSQEGAAWVADEACVFGEARVSGDAQVSERARVYGAAVVGDQAKIRGRSIVRDRAVVRDRVVVYGAAFIGDDAVLSGDAQVSGAATVTENAQVMDHAQVKAEARVFGHAVVSGKAAVGGDMILSQSDHIRKGRFLRLQGSDSTHPAPRKRRVER